MEEIDKSGCIACFSVPSEIGNEIAIDGYETVDDLHITLLKMKYNELIGSEKDMKYNVLSSLFKIGEPPKVGKIEGFKRFYQVQNGTKDVIVLVVSMLSELYEWRNDFIAILNMNGVEVYNNYTFRPHITLAYVDRETNKIFNDSYVNSLLGKEINFGSLEIRYNNDIFKL